jgi:hypothetical protein
LLAVEELAGLVLKKSTVFDAESQDLMSAIGRLEKPA